MLDIHGPQYRLYRTLRQEGWLPPNAYYYVRNDAILARIESAGLITFTWQDDTDLDKGNLSSDAEFAQEEYDKIISGEWSYEMCTASTAAEEYAASLGGITLTGNDRYRRQVEIDLADEAGMLPALPHGHVIPRPPSRRPAYPTTDQLTAFIEHMAGTVGTLTL